jgi:folate-dependent phosphoribosylglycinamide formyltransferase PurN
VPVLPGDTADALAVRVLRVEHRLYPRAVDHLCAALLEGRAPERMKDEFTPITSNTEEVA